MKKENWNESNIPDQSGKIFIVTGPTSGLGKESVKVLVRKNATVIMAARNIKKAESVANEILVENKNAKIDIEELDLTSLESIRPFCFNRSVDFSSKKDAKLTSGQCI